MSGPGYCFTILADTLVKSHFTNVALEMWFRAALRLASATELDATSKPYTCRQCCARVSAIEPVPQNRSMTISVGLTSASNKTCA